MNRANFFAAAGFKLLIFVGHKLKFRFIRCSLPGLFRSFAWGLNVISQIIQRRVSLAKQNRAPMTNSFVLSTSARETLRTVNVLMLKSATEPIENASLVKPVASFAVELPTVFKTVIKNKIL